MRIYYKKKFWAGVGALLLGLALVTASKKFYVEVDDRVTKVR